MSDTLPAKQLKPKPRAKRPEDFTLRDKLAVMALHVPGLIIGDERDGTTDEILRLFQVDHIIPCTFGGTREPQNGRPLRTGEHKAKSAQETRLSRKSDRIARTHKEWWQRVMAGAGQAEEVETPINPRKKAKLRSRNSFEDIRRWKEQRACADK